MENRSSEVKLLSFLDVMRSIGGRSKASRTVNVERFRSRICEFLPVNAIRLGYHEAAY